MWIKTLILENWGPFKDETKLELEPKAYAVTAEREGDADSSNWAGKSMLAESVMFALTGWVNPERRYDNADGWIHRGEPGGQVALTFDDGSVLARSRRRDKSTQLSFAGAKQEEAQKLVDEAVGLAEADLLATSFAAQREVAQLVRARGAELTGVFGAWLRLGKLEDAEARLSKAAEAAGEEAASVVVPREAVPAELPDLAAAEESEQGARGRVAGLEQRLSLAQRLHAHHRAKADLGQLLADGKRLRAEYDLMGHAKRADLLKAAEAAERTAGVTALAASEEAQRAGDLARGQFDGVCPVGKMQCPVSADLLAKRGRNAKLAQEAGALANDYLAALERRTQEKRSAQAKVQECERLAERLQTMREQAERMHASLPEEEGEAEDLGTLEMWLRDARGAHAALLSALSDARAAHRQADRARQAAAAVAPRIAAARAREALYGAAALVVRHARRRVAEEALGQIQAGANADLADLGVPLELLLRWQRQGDGLARSCEHCGRPFPASQRVKECECGKARGPLMVQKVDIQLSDRSGGAEDLAGVVLQLAASRWLREERQSAWEVAVLDEVFSALDASHRRSLAQQLPRMLQRASIRQALVISHSPHVDATFPGRIVVSRDGKVASARVAS